MLLVFYTARTTGDPAWPAEPLEVHIYLSGGYIVTVRRDACAALDDLHTLLSDANPQDEEVLVYRLLDALTDAYYPVIDSLEDERRHARRRSARPPPARTSAPRIPAQAVRAPAHRLVAAQRDQFQVAREAILGLEGLQARLPAYLRDIGDHLVQVAGEFQRQIDDLTALMQTYFNANSDRLNRVATRLTIGGTLFIIYTVVTGFFGQNFGWLVDSIDTKKDFLMFGVGGHRRAHRDPAHTVLGQAPRLVLRAA